MIRNRRAARPAAVLACAALLVTASCAHDIAVTPPPGERTEGVFDPSASDVPTPTNLVMDPTSGRLAIPLPDATKNPSSCDDNNKCVAGYVCQSGACVMEGETAFRARYLNTLLGYPTNSTVRAQFSGELADGTDFSKVVKVLEVDLKQNPPAAKEVTGLSFSANYNLADVSTPSGTQCLIGQARTTLTISNAAGWKKGHLYAFFVLGGASGLMDKGGKPVIRSTLFEVAAAKSPLCATNDQGACTYNYNSLLHARVKAAVEAANPELGYDALQSLIKRTELETATRFEAVRTFTDSLLGFAESAQIARDDVVLAWGFTASAQGELVFDLASGNIPGPANDLLIARADDPVNKCTTGSVCIPVRPGESDGDKATRLMLNTLDGFSTIAPTWATVLGNLDPATVTKFDFASNSGSFIVVQQTPTLDFNPPIKIEYDAANQAVIATPTAPLAENARYVIAAVSRRDVDKDSGELKSNKSIGGLADVDGNRVMPSSTFALARQPQPLVDAAGKSTVCVLDDATAGLLEGLRSGYAPLFLTLEQLQLGKTAELPALTREDIVVAWTFTTQSITKPLTELRQLPHKVLAASDNDQPEWSGAYSDATTIPAGVPKTNIAGWIASGQFTSLWAIDEKTRMFHPAASIETASVQQPINFTLTIPTGVMPQNGWPLVVYSHGITRARSDMLAIANALAAAGFAALSFDNVYHGDRTICTQDSDCQSGSTCQMDSTCGGCATPHPITNCLQLDATTGVPTASGSIGGGRAFIDTDNVFAARDNIRQYVVEMSALLRSVQLGALARGIANGKVTGTTLPVGLKLDASSVHLAGQSLGAMESTMIGAVESLPKRLVLNVPGSRWVFGLVVDSQAFKPLLDGVRQQRGITPGTLADLQLLTTFQWIIDPADPANFARFIKTAALPDLVTQQDVPAKEVIVQVAGADTTVTTASTQYLAQQIGVATTDTTYAGQGHGMLLAPSPDAPATAACQSQMATFFASGMVCKPDLQTGACN
ncbi:MAG: hypothetical protein KC503_34505 [Myxococcales bacterium]|nr:hypothetical protein [Myxococcales bacterium]